MSVKPKYYPNDPIDVAQGCVALLAMIAIPCIFVWGVFEWGPETWWRVGVSLALFVLFLIAVSKKC